MGEKCLSAHSTAEVVIEEARIDTHRVCSHNFWLWKRKDLSRAYSFINEPPGLDLYHLRLTLHYIWPRCAPHMPGRPARLLGSLLWDVCAFTSIPFCQTAGVL